MFNGKDSDMLVVIVGQYCSALQCLAIGKLIAEQYNLKKRVIKRVLRYSAVGRRTVSDIQHYKG